MRDPGGDASGSSPACNCFDCHRTFLAPADHALLKSHRRLPSPFARLPAPRNSGNRSMIPADIYERHRRQRGRLADEDQERRVRVTIRSLALAYCYIAVSASATACELSKAGLSRHSMNRSARSSLKIRPFERLFQAPLLRSRSAGEICCCSYRRFTGFDRALESARFGKAADDGPCRAGALPGSCSWSRRSWTSVAGTR